MLLLTFLTMTIEGKLSNSPQLQQQAIDVNTPSNRLIELASNSPELARLVALNPSTPRELLGELSYSKDSTTRKNVATNPNTSTEVLLNLVCEFPEQLVNNPTFSLLLLENPNLVDIIPLNTLQSILNYDTLPVSFIERAINQLDEDTLLLLAENPKTTKEVLFQLVNSQYSHVAEAARLHVKLAGEMDSGWDRTAIEALLSSTIGGQEFGDFLEQLEKINSLPEFAIESLPKNYSAFKKNTGNCTTPASELEYLAKDNNLWTQLFLANNPNTPTCVLQDLAKNNHVWLCQSLANNPNTPARVLQQLAKDNYRGVRQNVAKNPNTPENILKLLLSDSSESVRRFAIARYLAHNADGLFTVLKYYPIEYSTPCFSRLIVLMHPEFPSKLVQKCDSLVWLERYAIAQNSNTSLDLLKFLVNDSNRIVRAAAKDNLYQKAKGRR
ncbi:hypothetical protein PN499_08390 [Kamptonema animale CS-326]|jgi:hypothetical protein|uniref:variant leucine-rich repeat-containing protein n=1 Tax=Kamptonema animale TaxID=92934 RepID=UPI00232D99A1|nr:hypothetical protein [Kamptonema animale]MDB9511198.1 hypothetical protein [Kamptonema animale CS-326]